MPRCHAILLDGGFVTRRMCDCDMIPAFKFARREGIRVYLDRLGGPVKRELKAHVDLVL